VNGAVEYLHKDQLGSVKLITAADGTLVKTSTYAPYGEAFDEMLSLTRADETKGFIGERFDADAGLQYLNARYYDPRSSSQTGLILLSRHKHKQMRCGEGTLQIKLSQELHIYNMRNIILAQESLKFLMPNMINMAGKFTVLTILITAIPQTTATPIHMKGNMVLDTVLKAEKLA
jgi:hypothetical protein